MPRRNDDDEDEMEEEEQRPRRKKSRRRDDDDEDDDDRPRRKRKSSDRSFLDSTFADTSIVILILFGLCCGMVAVVLSIVALITCKDETARRNAVIVLIGSAIAAVVQTILFIMGSPGRM